MHLFALSASAPDEPIGEKIGPVIFWVLLIVLLGVIVWSFARMRRKTTRPRGSAPAVDYTRPEAYASHHTIAWHGSPETFVPDAAVWPLGVTAIFGICGNDPWNRLRHRTLNDARAGLTESWGIRSRAQLLARVTWLLREGHRADFIPEIHAPSRDLARSFSGSGSDASEQRWRLDQARANERDIRNVNFLAWDLVRAAMLVRAGYSLDWLSEEEATDTLNLIGAVLQATYRGWDDLGEQFTRARWYWFGGNGVDGKKEQAHDESRLRALLDPTRGPWPRLPWNTELPESRMLILDALVAEDLADQATIPPVDDFAERIDVAIARRLHERN